MKISFVSVESSILTVGFRRMASLARSIHPDTDICYVVPTNQLSLYSILTSKSHGEISAVDIESIGKHLAESEIVAFSCMTPFADLAKDIIAAIKKFNPKTYLIWGGIHPIVDTEDAIKYVDAACTGEGEFAFRDFLAAYKAGEDYTHIKNFWFKQDGRVIKNDFMPLQSNAEMDALPFPLYADNELIYKNGTGFVPMGQREYRQLNGISYHTVWSIGCPYKCSFCSNSKFIDNDDGYRRIRHSSVDRIIAEVKEVLRKHPYISAVTFHDDSFIGLTIPVLEEFGRKWREEINISFSVVGALPGLVRKQKIEMLVRAGMYRVKMGIQTGSDAILKFYKRPATVAITDRAVRILGEYTDYMIPPTYDMILDNPIETREDVVNTLRFVYEMPRPYTLNFFSLRIMPNTELARQFEALQVEHLTINDKSYLLVKPSAANILIFLIDIVKPPRKVFEYLLKYAQPYAEPQKEYPGVLSIVKTLYMFKRGWNHIRFLEFSYFPGFIGNMGYLLWKGGVLQKWHSTLLKKSAERLAVPALPEPPRVSPPERLVNS